MDYTYRAKFSSQVPCGAPIDLPVRQLTGDARYFRLQGEEWSFSRVINFRASVLIGIKNLFIRIQTITCLNTQLFFINKMTLGF